MEQRILGRTGRQVSIVGMGGIVVMNTEPAEARELVAEAIDRGVTYVDIAPSYGNAEERMGPALAPYRNRVFLACKTAQRTRTEAAEELRASLRRLQTDHFDLYQIHGLGTHEEMETALGPGGALEALEEARQAGLIGDIGFSAHSTEVAVEALQRYDFASVLFPLNFVVYHHGFGPQVIEAAQARGAARLALKSLARTRLPKGADQSVWPKCWYEPVADPQMASLALRWTLSLPITAAIPPGEARLFRIALDIAAQFTPITPEEEAILRQEAARLEPIFPLAA
ncbi:MAG: aldo/keto reductase [Armatimonadetes bacterium]|nr:aldo/keto reductase [Armatimonadota bacterium]